MTPPPRPASGVGLLGGERDADEHRGDREHAEQVGVVLAPRRRPSTSRIAQAPSRPARAPLPPDRDRDAAGRDREQHAARAADQEHEQRRPAAVAALEQPAEQEDRAERDDLVAGLRRR